MHNTANVVEFLYKGIQLSRASCAIITEFVARIGISAGALLIYPGRPCHSSIIFSGLVL
jgi:hypothetical protein